MRWSLILAAVTVAAPANAAQPAKAGPKPSALTCPDLQYLARERARPRAEMKKLNQLPPADAVYAMLRTKDGCPDPTPVKLRR